MKVTKAELQSTKRSENYGWPQRDSAEHEGYAGALIGRRITENNITNADRPTDELLERIVSRDNLNRAYKRVKKNKGAGGVDGMSLDELFAYRYFMVFKNREFGIDGAYTMDQFINKILSEL